MVNEAPQLLETQQFNGAMADRAQDAAFEDTTPEMAVPTAPKTVRAPLFRRRAIAVAAVVVCVVGLIAALNAGSTKDAAAHSLSDDPSLRDIHKAATLPVNTVRPRRKTLERVLEQPGSIEPSAQAELYAKTSGYLNWIRRAATPRMVAEILSQGLCGQESAAARLAVAAQLTQKRAPQIDIGSPVVAGDLLMEIAAPDRLQDIVEKASLVRQREAELEAARTSLATFDAAIQSAKAEESRAQADVRECTADHAFRLKEFSRLKELVKSRTVPQEIADEKDRQVSAALAGWESSLARVQAAHAELAVNSSKLATAHADIKVKQALVQVAMDQMRMAHVLADYSRIYAPFDGVITFRDVDVGDFVQNAASGQTRRLMTITALDQVRLVLQVPDRDAPWIQVGTEVDFAMAARGINRAKGYVARVAHTLDAQTRTMQVEIDVDNRDRRLLPGMYISKVTLILQRVADARAIPATAVFSSNGENFVIQVEDGVAHRHRVRIRYDDGKEMEVVKLIGDQEVPLHGSEELIVSNKGEISEGQRVRASEVAFLD